MASARLLIVNDMARPRWAYAVVGVAFCPHPPLLLPEAAGSAAGDTAVLRAAAVDAVSSLLDAEPEVVLVVGAGPPGVRYGAGDAGDLRGYGADVEQAFERGIRPGGRRTPLAHTVGAWLLDRSGHTGVRVGVAAVDLGEVLRELPGSVGVLAMGDGSACRDLEAPGHLDPAAAPFDAAVATALAAGDAAALAGLDPVEGERLLAAGVPTWQAVGAALRGRRFAARLRYDQAPFGVGYLVADWRAQ